MSRFRKLWKDEKGSYLVITAIGLPVIMGFVGLGTEVVLWSSVKERMQTAADNAALSGAVAYSAGQTSNVATESQAVAAKLGFLNQVTTTVTVNTPPTSGPNSGVSGAVEVIISQPQTRLISGIFLSGTTIIKARAVAVGTSSKGCALALDPTSSGAMAVSGSASMVLSNCSAYIDSNSSTALTVGNSSTMSARSVSIVGNTADAGRITATNGVNPHSASIADPYASVNIPSYSGCDYNNITVKTTTTLSPGVYCNGLTFNAGAVVTLSPGTYYLDRGQLKVNGGASISGTGVTIVFTSSTGSNYATAQINGGATFNVVAPTSGSLAGIALYADRNIPTGTTFTLNGGGGQTFGGAVYLPTVDLSYSGDSGATSDCVQVIGYRVSFTGNSGLKANCSGYGTKDIGSSSAKLSE